jgi:XTP/dITP diphosphohydrolase
MPRRLVLATRNLKKLRELEELLDLPDLELVTLDAFPHALDVDEVGDSFAANARLKATLQARQLGEWTLGEDSGLSVEALGGAPGVYSARFAGPRATDEDNNQLLLQRLAGVPQAERTAFYTCHAVIADPTGNVRAEAVGTCRGRMRDQPAGSGGFGYDPLFEIVEYHRTFGELAPAVKRAISHRARAIRQLKPLLERWLREGDWPTGV